MATRLTDDRTRFDAAIEQVDMMISSTYGAHGMNVSSAGWSDMMTFDDGRKAISLMGPQDPMEREAYFRIRDAANAQHSRAGDGTSTTMLLTCRLYQAGMRLVRSGIAPREVVNGIQTILDGIIKDLEEMAIKPDTRAIFEQVATIAMHGDKVMGSLIGGLVYDLGSSAIVTAEPSMQKELSVSRSIGYTWKRGVPDVGFFNRAGRMEYEDPYIVIVKAELGDIKAPIFERMFTQWGERVAGGKRRPLVVICSGISGTVPGTFLGNSKNGIPMALCSVPGEATDGDRFLQDLASVTGATVIDDMRGAMLDQFTWEWVGEAKKIVSTLKETTVQLLDTMGADSMEAWIGKVEGAIKAIYATDEMLHDEGMQDQMRRRIAALHGAVGIIRVPVVSETHFNELKESVEDGFQAARAAYSGILPGGGAALRYLTTDCENTPIGHEVRIVCSSLFATQCENAGLEEDKLADILLTSDKFAYNFATRQIGNFVEVGAIDPLEVVTGALRNAASVALPLVNTKYFVENLDGNNP